MAVQKFPVPEMGDSISEGTVLELSKQVGDYVALEEVLVVVETDKVTVDVRSPAAGTITKWFANPDDTIEGGPAAAAAPAGAPKMGAPPVGVSVDELPARFRRAPMSEDEMEAVMSGGASVSDWAWVKIRW
ncbi:hypothetical protein EMIHUDRAFT_204165 [Emiliania huxleyi CCMP1516]|uniref:Lipoyl-binding domain-containing protein n=2 Tax=Emiliania huxleyi TaxID=2903 RepID=A0A0D3JXV7_EMIH1|nr:hypothetical protein EMIHUDRAFT_204165 [Emiliania huxleyi CCMP1516]EOD28342.1 hypothetical protein EMIHUDRAFT_204165 [Emiliania huxleyi CCMP1516]|eukprot:XP_005780771.1 hypothetical protein EMIHUDRAFT_204165 [Emiliania huxleyi CCMP1516]